jgi:hypothetical protein
MWSDFDAIAAELNLEDEWPTTFGGRSVRNVLDWQFNRFSLIHDHSFRPPDCLQSRLAEQARRSAARAR